MEKKLCRICLSSDSGFDLFDAKVESLSLLWKLELCLHEQVLDKAGYPRRICKTCVDNLNTASNFVNKYMETRELLKIKVISNENDCLDIKEEFLDYCNNTIDNESAYEQEMVQNIKVEINPSENLSVESLLTNCKDITVKKINSTVNGSQAQVLANAGVKIIKKKTSQVKIKKEKCNSTPKRKDKIETKIKKVTAKKEQIEGKIIKLVIVKQEKTPPSEPKQYLCDFCALILKTSWALRQHINSSHYPTMQVQCDQCPKVFRRPSHLKRHVENKHMPPRYVCATCGKAFYRNNTMARHIKVVHLKQIKRPICPTCKKSFVNKLSLIIHNRSAHTGDRPAVCEVCGSRFFHEIYLREHTRLHTGETPFKCPVCQAGYAIRSNMVSHMKHNHRISDINQDIRAKISPAILNKLRP